MKDNLSMREVLSSHWNTHQATLIDILKRAYQIALYDDVAIYGQGDAEKVIDNMVNKGIDFNLYYGTTGDKIFIYIEDNFGVIVRQELEIGGN